MEYIVDPDCLEDRLLVESKCLRYYKRSGFKSLTLTLEVKDNVITVTVVKVNSILYNTDNGEETEESI